MQIWEGRGSTCCGCVWPCRNEKILKGKILKQLDSGHSPCDDETSNYLQKM